jgi:chromosome segregation ATPase
VRSEGVWKTPAAMAKPPSTPADLREAVERTVQATLGSAERQRERTQGALDDLAGTVDQLRRGAEAGLARGRRAIGDRRPATSEDIRELKAEIRRIGRRLDEIEDRLPAKRTASGGAKRSASSAGAKRSASGGAAKRSASSGAAKRSASGGAAKRPSSSGGAAKRPSSSSGGAKRSSSGGRRSS